MLKKLTLVAAAGVAAATLAMGGALTAHAQPPPPPPPPPGGPGTSGPCFTPTKNHPVQTEGSGANQSHAFNDSHNNCVDFEGNNDSAYLENSNFNFIFFAPGANHNSVDELKNSNQNSVNFLCFITCSTGDTLSANGANGNTVDFSPFANSTNEFVSLIGTQNDFIFVDDSNGFAQVFGNNGVCDITPGTGGTKNNPAIVIC